MSFSLCNTLMLVALSDAQIAIIISIRREAG